MLCHSTSCTGCTACASVCPKNCITMKADADGFSYPVVNEAVCVGCGLCEMACPILADMHYEHTTTAYAARSLDTAMRLESSSGGVFTELARIILADHGAVFGAAYNDQFEVIHICAEDEKDLAKLRGAKYAQSDLRGIFPEVKKKLDAGQQVLFSGTPCQVAGLKAFLRKDYKNLITVDFICHSVPSPMAWQEYLKYRARIDSNGGFPVAINLRSKETGWSHYQYSNLFQYSDDHAHATRSRDSLYMKLFVGGYISRESCSTCQFKGYHRISDLTLGDFWGIWNIAPEMDDDKGTSVVLCQTEAGRQILRKIQSKLILKPVALSDVSQENTAILNSLQQSPDRKIALELIRDSRIQECERFFATHSNAFAQYIRNTIRKIFRH